MNLDTAPLCSTADLEFHLDSLSGWQNIAYHPYVLDNILLFKLYISSSMIRPTEGLESVAVFAVGGLFQPLSMFVLGMTWEEFMLNL